MPWIKKEHYRHKLLPSAEEFPLWVSVIAMLWLGISNWALFRLATCAAYVKWCQQTTRCVPCRVFAWRFVCLCTCECDASWGYQSECNNRLIWACRLTYNITYNINVPPRPSILCLCMYARMNNSKFWTVICIDNAMTQRQRQRQFHIGAPRAFLFYFIYFDPIVPAMFAEIHVLCTHTHIHTHIQTCINVYSYSI